MQNLLTCADASMVAKLILVEADSGRAALRWETWLRAGQTICAPQLLPYEVASALRLRVWRKLLTRQEAAQAFQDFLALDVVITDPPGLGMRALELAHLFNRPNAYDAHYLALAEALDCELWTADERLYDAVKGELVWVRGLGAWEADGQ